MIDKTQFQEELDTMIEDCEHRSERLSDWESGFIDSISKQLEKGKTLTAKQYSKLEAIWERVTAKGTSL